MVHYTQHWPCRKFQPTFCDPSQRGGRPRRIAGQQTQCFWHGSFILRHVWGFGEVYLRKLSVCLLSKLQETSASNGVNVQIKGRNQTITWPFETVWLLLHNSFPPCAVPGRQLPTRLCVFPGRLKKTRFARLVRNLASEPSMHAFTWAEHHRASPSSCWCLSYKSFYKGAVVSHWS